MGRALYREHRPKSLSEVVGQEHITKTLSQALKQGRLSHAYLFTGPRGIGKTSVARILAHEINGLPYTDDSAHVDIIEIDAASNRRIDEIRDLRDKVYISPALAKYKVYIIDEVHMLTREAFNALLKTLEEPPEHVIFILATTDAHKLPDTIISRTQRFSFKPADTAILASYLKEIATSEKIKSSDEALKLIAEHSEGSFRDALSLLDQASNHSDRLEESGVRELLGLPPSQALEDLIRLLSQGSGASEIMSNLANMYAQGYQANVISKQLGQILRTGVASNTLILPLDDTLDLLSRLVEVPASFDPNRALEIALLKTLASAASQAPSADFQSKSTNETPPPNEVETEPSHKVSETPKKEKPAPVAPTKKGSKTLDAELWPAVLDQLKRQYNTLYGIARMAQPEFSDKTLTLTFAFDFHQKRLNEKGNRQKLVDIIENLTGKVVTVECLVDKSMSSVAKEPVSSEKAEDKKPENDELSAISNIFGNAELLES